MAITHIPSTIGPGQLLLIRFPSLSKHDVIVTGTARLAFTITLSSVDANRTVVQNLGRAIVEKTTIRVSGNEMMSIDNSDVYHCCNEIWRISSERKNNQYQGIDTSENRNTTRIRVGARDRDEAIAADKPLPTLSAIGSSFLWISRYSRAKLLSTRASSATDSSTS